MHSNKLFPGLYLVSSIQYFQSQLPFFLIYAIRNDVFVKSTACLSSIRSRITDIMYIRMASCQPKCSLLANALYIYHIEGKQLADGTNGMNNE